MILIPAKGDDYQTANSARQAFEDGMNWKIQSFDTRWHNCYCNIQDFLEENFHGTLILKYNNLQSHIHVEFP